MRKIIFLLFVFVSANLTAQIVNGEAFLQGTYAEVGIGSCGSFGTSYNSPAGYHSRVSSNVGNQSLGFVADTGKDGWSTGFPDFVGDYFLPGSPEEGWGLTIDGVNYNNNQKCSVNDIPGSIISYNATASQVEATWQGNIGGLNITAKTYIPNNSLYFVTTVTVTNTSASTINNVYYMRNVDPDQGIFTPGGGNTYETINSIIHQNPNPCNNALVTATTSLGSYYLGLGSIDPRAIVTTGGFSNRSAIDIWNGNGFSTSGTLTADQAISIAFNLGNLAPNDSTTFSYTYVLSESDLNNALAATNIGLNLNTVTYTTGSNVNTCENTSIPINLTNTGTFNSWTWTPTTGLDTATGTSVNATITSTTTYTAVGTGPCGSISITITLNPVPAIPVGDATSISGPTLLTLGQTGVNYSIPAVNGATKYTWVLPSGSIVTSGLNTNSITFDAPYTSWCGNISVTPSNDCNSGGSADLPICLGNQLITGNVNSPFCAGQLLTVPYTASGVYSVSNIFSVQLSDASGNFIVPYTTIGSITGSSLSGNIPATIPSSTLQGANYRIRVVSNLPVLNGIDNGSDLIINAPSAPMSISQSFCNGATINDLVATGSNIQWYDVTTGGAALNNTMALDNGNYYATQTINGCESNTRTSIVVTINPNLTPTVSISSSATTICTGASVAFTATPANTGGGTINYDFKVNGTSVQSGSSNQFTTTTLADGSSVTCDVTVTGGTCLTVPFAISDPIIINVNPPIVITSTPTDVTVSNDLGVCQAMVTYPAATAMGIPTPTITYSQDSGTIFSVGTTTLMVTATNTCGSVTSSFTVTVNDTESPVITTPSDISVNNDLNTCGAVVNYTAPTVLDNCVTSTSGNQTFNYTGNLQTWTVPAGVTSITINGKGAQGGSGYYGSVAGGLGADITGAISVTPGESLSILVGGKGQQWIGAGGGGGGTYIWKNTGNLPQIIAGGGGGGGWRGTSAGSGSDTIIPSNSNRSQSGGTGGNGGTGGVFAGAGSISGQAGGGAGWYSNGLDGTGPTPNATGGTFPLATVNPGAGGFGFNSYTNSNTYGGYGGGGGTAGSGGSGGGGGGYNGGGGGDSWDGTSWGSGGGGGSYNIGTSQNNTAGVNSGDGIVTISWLGSGGITQIAGLPSGSIFPVGTTTNTFSATDASGNIATSSFTVTVTDNELPTIACPTNVTVNNDSGVCFATGVVLGTPITNDNCSVASITNDAPTQFALGNNTVTWTVTDASGNSTTCSQIVTVIDNELPTITCPANVTVNNDADVCYATGVALDTPVTSDNCSVASVTNDAPTQFPVGDTVVTWTVTDGSGNTSTCTQTVTVNSTILPLVTIDASPNGPICAGASITFTATPTNTSGGTVNYDFKVDGTSVQSSSSNQFTTTTLVDGNSVTCDITITGSTCLAATTASSNSVVINVNPPIIITSTPTDVIVSNDSGVCQATVTYPAATAAGIPTPTITYSQDSGTIFPVGTTAVTVTATNTCGSVTSSFTVTVNDTEAPIITTPSDISVNNDINTCGAVVNYTTPTAIDNCGTNNSNYLYDPTKMVLYNNNLYYLDGSGGTCSTGFELAPQSVLSNISTLFVGKNYFSTISENCCIAHSNQDIEGQNWGMPYNCNSPGPFVAGPELGAIGCTNAHNSYPGQLTLCQSSQPYIPTSVIVTQIAGLPSGSIFPVGTTTNTFSATDASGNIATSSFTVTVTDNELPTIACPTNVTVNNDSGVCFATGVVLGTPITNDNCSVASITNDAPTQFALGNNTVTWTVTDASGNSTTCSQIVTVIDNELPTITCPANVTVNNDADVCYATGVALDTPVTSDNCSVASVTNDAPTQFPVGDTVVTWTVTDGSGNTSTCTQTVTVNSTILPLVTIDASPNGPICAGASITFTATPTNTGGGTVNYDFKIDGTSVQSGSSNQFTSTTLVDGNSVTCDITITGSTCLAATTASSNSVVINVNPPIVITSTPTDVTVSNDSGVCQAMVTYPAAIATGIPTPTITYSQDSGSIFPVGATTVTVTATNTCGSVTSSFMVTVNDTEAPVITAPSDISVNNDLSICGAVVNYTTPTAIDNCVATPISGSQQFAFTGALETFTVPVGVTSINVLALGAQGGSVNTNCSASGGLGASIKGDITVTPGEVISILVGEQGHSNDSDAGGGGGSFVVRSGNIPLIVAGGGGGASNNIAYCGSNLNGIDASLDTSGTASADGIIAGGTPTNGGGANNGSGGGGGGFLIDGTAGTGSTNNNGKSYINGGAGGSGNDNDSGGYGGGGAGWFIGGNGGGGGGYAGGGTNGSYPYSGGGGGGSFNSGTNQVNVAGVNTGNGSVTITWNNSGSGVTVVQTTGLPSGSTFPVGTTTNTFSATDASGNIATSSFTVTVTDTELPTITCPANILVNSDPGVCYAAGVTLDTPVTNDNCSLASVTNDAPTQFPVGDTVVTWTVVDASGNFNTCTQTITVNSTIVPTVIIDASPTGPICTGATVIFTATAANVSDGLVNYNFMVNGNSVQNGTSNTFNSNSLLNNDVVTCEINISNTICLATTITSSNSLVMMVNPQPAQPTLACYETATFNTTTCSWEVTGTQPIQPTLACYESAIFNTISCSWEVTGSQPLQPTLACYETAAFNTTSCSWDVTGTAPAVPTGDIVQTFSVANLLDATLSNLVVNPGTVIWYASLNDALNGSNPLSNTTVLTNGSTYYAVNSISGCSSTPFAVTVSVTLGIDSFDMSSIYIYPNPTTSILNIQSSIPVDKIVITDMLGKILRIQTTNTSKVDVEQFAAGTYILETTFGERKFISKFIKK